MNEWISVDERLPETKYDLYLVWRDTYNDTMVHDVCEFTNGAWYSFDGVCNPTHWQPLPDPPEVTT